MISAAVVITTYLMNALWQVPLVAAAGWLVSRLVKRLGPLAAHVTWVVTLASAALTPALSFMQSLSRFFLIPSQLSAYTPVLLVSAQGSGQQAAGMHTISAVLIEGLSLLYVASVLYFGLRFGWSLRGTMRLVRASAPSLLTTDQAGIWSDCRQAFSLQRVHILCSSAISGPVVLGLHSPVLLLPIDFAAGCSAQDLLTAFAHECAHIKRRDFLKNLLYEAGSLLIAFHPVCWLIKSQIARTREIICDGMATTTLIDSRRYSESLLRLASMISMTAVSMPTSGRTLHAIGIFDANILEQRIMMLHVKQRKLSWAAKFGLLIPAAFISLAAVVGGAAMAVVLHPQAPANAVDQAMPDGPIYRVGKDVSAPTLIKSVDPEFPQSARGARQGFEGICLLRLVVDESGMPRDVHITRSLGPDFDANAVASVQQYRFKPALRSGRPVAVTVAIEVHYAKY